MTKKPESKSSEPIRAFDPDPELSRFKKMALIGFIILFVGIIIVVAVLPAYLAKKKNHAQELSIAESTKPIDVVDKELESKAKAAQEYLNKVLKIQARLENDGIKIWGEEKLVTSYDDVLALLAKANADFDAQHYDEALKNYQNVEEKLKQLEKSRPKRIQQAMHKGDDAFAQLDGELAQQYYAIAVAADSSNTKAQTSLQRAKTLPEVLDALEQGQEYERSGKLSFARQKYGDAIALDKDFQSAKDHFQRVDVAISNYDFQESMSEATTALNQGNIKQAKDALATAKNLQPDSTDARDLGQQLDNAALYFDFRLLGQKALEHEMAEEWSIAADIYNGILKMDPHARFAQEGKERTEEFIELVQKIQSYIIRPDELQAPEHLRHARQIYEVAVIKDGIGPKLRTQLEQLNSLLEQHGKPVVVVVQSDNMTDVQIYRVGQLGKFLERDVELLPGSYKAVGIRSGYRDVTVPFTVAIGSEQVTIKVFCEEKI